MRYGFNDFVEDDSILRDLPGQVQKGLGAATQYARNAVNTAGPPIRQAANDLTGGVRDVTNRGITAARDFGGAFRDVGRQMGQGVRDAFDATRSAGQHLGQTVGQTIDDVTATGRRFGQRAEPYLQQAGHVAQQAGRAAHAVVDPVMQYGAYPLFGQTLKDAGGNVYGEKQGLISRGIDQLRLGTSINSRRNFLGKGEAIFDTAANVTGLSSARPQSPWNPPRPGAPNTMGDRLEPEYDTLAKQRLRYNQILEINKTRAAQGLEPERIPQELQALMDTDRAIRDNRVPDFTPGQKSELAKLTTSLDEIEGIKSLNQGQTFTDPHTGQKFTDPGMGTTVSDDVLNREKDIRKRIQEIYENPGKMTAPERWNALMQEYGGKVANSADEFFRAGQRMLVDGLDTLSDKVDSGTANKKFKELMTEMHKLGANSYDDLAEASKRFVQMANEGGKLDNVKKQVLKGWQDAKAATVAGLDKLGETVAPNKVKDADIPGAGEARDPNASKSKKPPLPEGAKNYFANLGRLGLAKARSYFNESNDKLGPKVAKAEAEAENGRPTKANAEAQAKKGLLRRGLEFTGKAATFPIWGPYKGANYVLNGAANVARPFVAPAAKAGKAVGAMAVPVLLDQMYREGPAETGGQLALGALDEGAGVVNAFQNLDPWEATKYTGRLLGAGTADLANESLRVLGAAAAASNPFDPKAPTYENAIASMRADPNAEIPILGDYARGAKAQNAQALAQGFAQQQQKRIGEMNRQFGFTSQAGRINPMETPGGEGQYDDLLNAVPAQPYPELRNLGLSRSITPTVDNLEQQELSPFATAGRRVDMPEYDFAYQNMRQQTAGEKPKTLEEKLASGAEWLGLTEPEKKGAAPTSATVASAMNRGIKRDSERYTESGFFADQNAADKANWKPGMEAPDGYRVISTFDPQQYYKKGAQAYDPSTGQYFMDRYKVPTKRIEELVEDSSQFTSYETPMGNFVDGSTNAGLRDRLDELSKPEARLNDTINRTIYGIQQGTIDPNKGADLIKSIAGAQSGQEYTKLMRQGLQAAKFGNELDKDTNKAVSETLQAIFNNSTDDEAVAKRNDAFARLAANPDSPAALQVFNTLQSRGYDAQGWWDEWLSGGRNPIEQFFGEGDKVTPFSMGRKNLDDAEEAAPFWTRNGISQPGMGVGYEWGQYGQAGDDFMRAMVRRAQMRKKAIVDQLGAMVTNP